MLWKKMWNVNKESFIFSSDTPFGCDIIYSEITDIQHG